MFSRLISLALLVPALVFAEPLASNDIAADILNHLTQLKKRQLDENKMTGQARFVSSQQKTATFIVIIDAGHGGKDPGARGSNGTKEKDIVLAIAKKLAKEVNAHAYMRAVLTRHGDYYVSLRDRLKLARKGDGDIFVAIHADAYGNDNALGASVFALSEHGATSEAARWLAQKDNYSELDGVALNALPDRDPMLRSVLVDLAQTATIQDSIRLGARVLDSLDDISSLHYARVERAPFMVLKSPDIPSILVETGFISNPKEEKRLSEIAYQDQVAHALWKGINKYFQQYGVRRV